MSDEQKVVEKSEKVPGQVDDLVEPLFCHCNGTSENDIDDLCWVDAGKPDSVGLLTGQPVVNIGLLAGKTKRYNKS